MDIRYVARVLNFTGAVKSRYRIFNAKNDTAAKRYATKVYHDGSLEESSFLIGDALQLLKLDTSRPVKFDISECPCLDSFTKPLGKAGKWDH